MIINFNEIQEKEMKNFKGGEKSLFTKMIVDEDNRIMLSKLIPGASIGEHIHDITSEIIFILQGKGLIICDGKEEVVEAGVCHYCPKGSTHTFINNGQEDILFYAVVPQHN
jgi:mannose-6-phosphate isomerase-like protein (cupin superfamily)